MYHPATRHVWITFLFLFWLSKASLLVGRHINREDDNFVASSAAGSAIFVGAPLTMGAPEVKEAVVFPWLMMR